MISLACFIIALFFALVVALEGTVTDNPTAWMFVFLALGFVFDHLPYGPDVPRRG